MFKLLKTFERILVLTTHNNSAKNIALKTLFSYGSLQKRSLACSAVSCNKAAVQKTQPGTNEGDDGYIVPYKPEYEGRASAKMLVEALRTKFRLSEAEVEHIMNDQVFARSSHQKHFLETLETLCAEGVTRRQFIEYPWLLTLNKNRVLEKINILKSINGFQDINDFVPFLRLQVPRLLKLVSSLNRDSNYVNCSNRVYYIAESLNVPPSTVTKYLAKRLFVLEMPWEMFDKNLQHMISYNVEPMNILKDLWGFRYAPSAVELRLKRALQAKKDKIMPWMVRCPEPILQKSLQIALDEQRVLGERSSVAEYIGERLGFTAEEAQAIMNKHPQCNTVRVKKVKEVLDYLLDVAKFTRHEVAQAPRILCHSLKTTKKRLEELKQYGCRPSSLVIVCRSKREYDKFLRQWCESHIPNKSSKQQGKE